MPPLPRQLFNYITHLSVCQQLFLCFLQVFSNFFVYSAIPSRTAHLVYHIFPVCQVLFYFSLTFSFFNVSAPSSVPVLYTSTGQLSTLFLHYLHYLQKGGIRHLFSMLSFYKQDYCYFRMVFLFSLNCYDSHCLYDSSSLRMYHYMN